MTATLHCSASHSEDHSVARRQQASGYYGNQADVESGKSLCPGGSKKAPGGLCSPSSAPPMEAPLGFQLWDLGSRQQMPSDRPERGARKMGYSELCPCKPRALVEDVAPEMGLRGRQPKPGNLTLLLSPNWLSAETSLALGHKKKGRQDQGGIQSHTRGLQI